MLHRDKLNRILAVHPSCEYRDMASVMVIICACSLDSKAKGEEKVEEVILGFVPQYTTGYITDLVKIMLGSEFYTVDYFEPQDDADLNYSVSPELESNKAMLERCFDEF